MLSNQSLRRCSETFTSPAPDGGKVTIIDLYALRVCSQREIANAEAIFSLLSVRKHVGFAENLYVRDIALTFRNRNR